MRGGPNVVGYFTMLSGSPTHYGGQNANYQHNNAGDDDGDKSFTRAIRNDELLSRGAFLLRQSCHNTLFGSGRAVFNFGTLTRGFGSRACLGLTHGGLVGAVCHFG